MARENELQSDDLHCERAKICAAIHILKRKETKKKSIRFAEDERDLNKSQTKKSSIVEEHLELVETCPLLTPLSHISASKSQKIKGIEHVDVLENSTVFTPLANSVAESTGCKERKNSETKERKKAVCIKRSPRLQRANSTPHSTNRGRKVALCPKPSSSPPIESTTRKIAVCEKTEIDRQLVYHSLKYLKKLSVANSASGASEESSSR